MTILEARRISRRTALTGLAGISFWVALGDKGLCLLGSAEAATVFNASPWVRIAPDGTTTIYTITEMGQGSSNAIPIILAEEMDADWSKVALEWAPSEPEIYGWRTPRGGRIMVIAGSRAVMMYYDDLRHVGAQIRKILMMNAAERWGVDPASLRTEPGVVIDPAKGAQMTYGEIAAFGKVPATPPSVGEAELKPKKEFRLIGKSVPRRDLPLKVDGSAQYAIDVHLPGMVYATALHSPAHGNAPESWNDAAIRAMPGVIATHKLASGIAVVAETYEQAIAARAALKATWTKNKTSEFNSERALADYVKIADDPSAKVKIVQAKGDAAAAFAGAAKRYKAEVFSDYTYHGQMEPLNATARFNETGDRLEVWDGSQALGRCRALLAKSLGMKPQQIEVHQCYLGGAFGRRSLADYSVEAALIARAVKRPVKLLWTREEDVANGMFRPQTFQRIEAALDRSGKVVGWRHLIVGDDGGMHLLTTGMNISPYYTVANRHLELRDLSHGVRLKHWRAVAHNFNLFAIEGLVDEIAAKEGIDPVDFRLRSMSLTPKARAVVEKVVQMADWKGRRPAGRALGFAITERSGSLGAGVVEASLDRSTGKLRVHKVWLAVDGGTIVTPEAAKDNVESGIVYGLSSTLFERITLRDGAVQQSNFNNYHVMRMADMPEELHVAFLERDTRPTGLGEIGTPFLGAAVANAFAKLTGKRLTHMPFTPERVQDVLKG